MGNPVSTLRPTAPETALARARRLASEAAAAAQDQAREARALLDSMVETAEAVAALDAVPGGVRQIWATQARQLRTAGLNIDAIAGRPAQ